MSDSATSTDAPIRTDFIRQIVRDDLASGKHSAIKTRFPPEPNGYLHIGHAKAICLDFGVAAEFGGVCNLRLDDTNPAREDPEYVRAIQDDVRWLGFDWHSLRHASDYFGVYYLFAGFAGASGGGMTAWLWEWHAVALLFGLTACGLAFSFFLWKHIREMEGEDAFDAPISRPV